MKHSLKAAASGSQSSWLVAMRARSMLGSMLLVLMLFFGAQANAEPVAASQALQVTKVGFQVLRVNFQIGQSFAAAGNAQQARSAFVSAQIRAVFLGIDAVRLQQQNQDTLNTGAYTNLQAQQQAVSLSNSLRLQSQVLSSQLSVLAQNPLSQNLIAAVNSTLVQTSITLVQLEQAMIRAQR